MSEIQDPYVLAIQGNLALLRVIETLDELDDGGLARAGGSHYGCGLAGLEDCREFVKNELLLAGGVAEGDLAELDKALHLPFGQCDGCRVLLQDLWDPVDDVVGTLAGDLTLHDRFHLRCDLSDAPDS